MRNTSNETVAEWVRVYGTELYLYAFRRLGVAHDAEDVVQETFFAALRNYESFRAEASVRTWLYTILKSRMIDVIRSRKRTEVESKEIDIDNVLFDETGHWRQSTVPQAWTSDDFHDYVNSCLSKLTVTQRSALLLTHLDDAPAEEIRKELGITASNYWVILHRARHYMRLCIEKNRKANSDDM